MLDVEMTALFHLFVLLVIANAMPDFYRSMKERLRTPEQGADTVVWLAVSEAAVTNASGKFFHGMSNTHIMQNVYEQQLNAVVQT